MSKTMDFRVKINSNTQPELFKAVDFFPANSRSELARKAMTEYLRAHFHMDIPVDDLDIKSVVSNDASVGGHLVNEANPLSKKNALSMIE